MKRINRDKLKKEFNSGKTLQKLADKYNLSTTGFYYIVNKNYRERIKKWRNKNKNKTKFSLKKFNLSWKGMYCKLKNNSLTRNYKFRLSRESFGKWFFAQKKICSYCGRTYKEIKKHDKKFNIPTNRWSIDRKNNDNGYTINNIALCCYLCNIIKRDFFTYEQMKKIGKFLKKYILK